MEVEFTLVKILHVVRNVGAICRQELKLLERSKKLDGLNFAKQERTYYNSEWAASTITVGHELVVKRGKENVSHLQHIKTDSQTYFIQSQKASRAFF